MLSRAGFRVAALGGLLILSMVVAGCGLKADPIPPRLVPPPVAAPATESVAEGILLTWLAAGSDGRIDRFRILRAEETRECPGCPQEFRPLATLPANDPALRKEGEAALRYVDADVVAGRFYLYRISACDSRGQCGEPSAPVRRLREKH